MYSQDSIFLLYDFERSVRIPCGSIMVIILVVEVYYVISSSHSAFFTSFFLSPSPFPFIYLKFKTKSIVGKPNINFQVATSLRVDYC